MVLYDSRGVANPSGLTYTEANVRQAVGASGLAMDSGHDFIRRFIHQD
jgi:hypothetical protein